MGVKKVSKIMRKCFQHDTKMRSKIHERSLKIQAWKSDDKSIGHMMVYDSAEPRFALYSSLILHIGLSEKERKRAGKSMKQRHRIN